MPEGNESSILKVGLAQLAPVVLDRRATLSKVVQPVSAAAEKGCALVCFGEALVPGYPVWVSRTDGSRFDTLDQKQLHALYAEQAVQPMPTRLSTLLAHLHHSSSPRICVPRPGRSPASQATCGSHPGSGETAGDWPRRDIPTLRRAGPPCRAPRPW